MYQDILIWWFTIFIIGVVFLPLTIRIFSNFFDLGYIFTKILGLAIISYVIFLLGVLHLFPFTPVTIIGVLLLSVVINLLIAGKDLRSTIKQLNKGTLTVFLLEEIIFFIALFFWSYVRAHAPDIHGLEKFMDFGFVNSILRSKYFPPRDMWFTPFPINYYYFGHLVTAVLTKLSDIPSNITFNLMVATIFAFTFTASFSIGANLLKNFKFQISNFKLITGGLLTAFLVTFAGNLHTIYTFFKPYQNDSPVPFWQLPFSPMSFPNSYWYPNATRFIYHTIHEFPIYSFVVSDLHGHVLDIPFVLLMIAILLSLVLKSQITNHKSQINSKLKYSKSLGFLNFNHLNFIWNLEFGIWNLPLISFLLAVMYMTNAWDALIYFLLAALVFLVLIFLRPISNLEEIENLKLKILNWFSYLIILGLGFIIFALPFNLYFKPFVSGIGIICAPTFLTNIGKIGPFLFEPNHCDRSPLWQLFILYGFFYFWVIPFLIPLIKKEDHKSQITNHKQSQSSKSQNSKIRYWNLFGIWNFDFEILSPSDIFVLLLIILSTILIIIPEFVYVKDIYPTYYRANTMFKLVYQAFIMLSISSGYIIIKLISNFKPSFWKLVYWTLGIIVLFIVSIYPFFAIPSYYNNFKINYGLDGIKYLKNLYPTDYQAILWINKDIKGQPVILEAQGDSYTDYARVSANTGLPTVLGWTVHEWLWRGSYDVPAPRINEAKTLYETTDINIAQQLIDKYRIAYVFIGDLEYQKYPNLDEAKFQKLGKVVYQNGITKIYKITSQVL